jgi:hypothetical protein
LQRGHVGGGDSGRRGIELAKSELAICGDGGVLSRRANAPRGCGEGIYLGLEVGRSGLGDC